MDGTTILKLLFAVFVLVTTLGMAPTRRYIRTRRYTRGRRVADIRDLARQAAKPNSLMLGNIPLPPSAATNHFLFAATSGGAKTLLQRRLMASVLKRIKPGTDSRCLIIDAKNDIAAFLSKIGVTCQVYSLNPFEARKSMPRAMAWDIAADIDNPAVALNFVSGLFPEEQNGSNRFWTDAARNGVTAVLESLIRHSPGDFTFSDFVFITLSLDRIKEVLQRDEQGRDDYLSYFCDENTAFKVFAVIASRMAYFKSVAALWQRMPRERHLSIRQWLIDDAILILGTNARVKQPLDVINELIFRVIVEEVDMQSNSASRRTWVWIDEARLAGPLLRRDLLPTWAVKSRSKGGVLVLAFQDVGGFREACGSDKLANEICAMCSYKVLGRMESSESAEWASRLVGRYDTIEWFANTNSSGARTSHGMNEQRVQRDEILPSEFYSIPIPRRKTGATAVFLGPDFAGMDCVSGEDLEQVVVTDQEELDHGFVSRLDKEQWLIPWTKVDRRRLVLEIPSFDDAKPLLSNQLGKRKQARSNRILKHHLETT